ncbi:hypothetical protein [Pseudomonas sp. PD9R]|uniref:DUF6896 domain-containing protein n=1 Tax=Pseudomonas sp. PD9R TaxID=2853534 RepID=UPI001C489258|nr:hypothetical protein [Pseudomonas sp. PD9R]MBV6826444.1 hypothetical protein [Pseudomonas sp. PD9R]
MDTNLSRVITNYQICVRKAVELMQRSGIPLPSTSLDWIDTDIPNHGKLKGDIPYYKHGHGCTVYSSDGKIDFDFGEDGEIDGFDLWRLSNFAKLRPSEHGHINEKLMEKLFAESVKNGSIIHSGYLLYYIANTNRVYAIEALNISPSDKLPSSNQDPVLTLYTHYFLAADLMRNNYLALDKKWLKKNRLSQGEQIKIGVYLSSWLGFLAVTCEGFNKLNMRLLLQNNRPPNFQKLISASDDIGKTLKLHTDALRKFRNTVFHLRDNIEAVNHFFAHDADRLPWAIELHSTIEKFFSKYRVQCEVHYLTNDRQSESQLGRMKSEPVIKKVN